MRRLLTVIAVFGLFANAWTRADEESKKLDGSWQVTEAEMAGMKLPEAAAQQIKLELSGDHYVVTTAEGKDEGTVRLMPDKTPKAMDITGVEGPNKGKKFLAIYELEGDVLKICYDLKGQERPTEFKTKPKTLLFLATYRKQKP